MIVVATALIGPTESVGRPPVVGPGVRCVCYTDRDVQVWERLAPPDGYPRLAARRAKMRVLDDFPDAEWSIWMDAAFDMIRPPQDLVAAAIATGCDVAAFRHHDRDRLRDEAREVIRLGFAPADLVRRQVEAYRLAGFDTDENPQTVLTTTGLLVRRHTPAVQHAFTRRWLDEIERWTIRDQLSVDYTAWRTGVEIGYLPGQYHNNAFVFHDRIRHRIGRVAA